MAGRSVKIHQSPKNSNFWAIQLKSKYYYETKLAKFENFLNIERFSLIYAECIAKKEFGKKNEISIKNSVFWPLLSQFDVILLEKSLGCENAWNNRKESLAEIRLAKT